MASNALAPAEQTALAEVRDMAGGILAVIERAVRDPSVDIDKMERLFALQERVLEREAKAAFVSAKIEMRAELPAIDQRGRIQVREKDTQGKRTGELTQDTPFARFEDIHAAVMPILSEHGFDLSFRNGMAPDGKVRVTTILSHVAGHSEETYFDLPHDTSGSKNAVQAIGSSTSYAKRYGMLSILNIRVAGEDDDGETGGAPEMISQAQFQAIESKITEKGANTANFCKFLKVPALAALPASRFDEAMKALEMKKAPAK